MLIKRREGFGMDKQKQQIKGTWVLYKYYLKHTTGLLVGRVCLKMMEKQFSRAVLPNKFIILNPTILLKWINCIINFGESENEKKTIENHLYFYC